jgi:hypothetical protein
VISTWSEENNFGTYNYVRMSVAVKLNNNLDVVMCLYTSTENNFDKSLPEVENVIQSIKATNG